jgi:hypothetical protein
MPSGSGRYDAEVHHKYAGGASAGWRVGVISVAGDEYTDNVSDSCSQLMVRVATGPGDSAEIETAEAAVGEGAFDGPDTREAEPLQPPSEAGNAEPSAADVSAVQPGAGSAEEEMSELALPPKRIVLRGLAGQAEVVAELTKTGDRAWEWTEGDLRVQFRALSETGTELLIHDPGSDRYHHLILTTGETFWRMTATGDWAPHYAIVEVERSGDALVDPTSEPREPAAGGETPVQPPAKS